LKTKWYTRAIYISFALALLVSLAAVPAVGADPGTSKWTKYGTPTEDDIVILPGMDVISYAVTGDDGMTVYAIGTWYDTDATADSTLYSDGQVAENQMPMLWKTTDGGVSWSDKTSKVQDAKNLPDDFVFFTAVAAAPDDPDFAIVAGYKEDGETMVAGTDNGGSKWHYMGCATVAGEILSAAVSMEVDDVRQIAVGTDNGNIWRYEWGSSWSSYWQNTTGWTGASFTAYPGWWTAEFDISGWVLHASETGGVFDDEWGGEDLMVTVTTDFVDGGDLDDEVFTATYVKPGGTTDTVDITIPYDAEAGDTVGPLGVTAVCLFTPFTFDAGNDGTAGAFDIDLEDHMEYVGDYDVATATFTYWIGETVDNSDVDVTHNPYVDSEYYDVDYVKNDGTTATDNFSIDPLGNVNGLSMRGCVDIYDISPTSIDVYDVTSLAFSPNYDIDDTILAIIIGRGEDPDYGSYDAFFLVGGTWDTINAWNQMAEFDDYPVRIDDDGNLIEADSNKANFFLRHTTDLALPYDYKGDDERDRVVMVSVNGEQVNPSTSNTINEGGYAFFIEDTTLSCELLAHEDNPWAASIAYYGSIDEEGKAMVGLAWPEGWTWDDITDWYTSGEDLPCCEGVDVLRSEAVDVCCPDWDWAQKPPTGQFNAQVAFTPDGDLAYATTEGCSRGYLEGATWTAGEYADESAFSVSTNDGDCWNQTGLIDTDIDYLADMAVNPACGYVYLLSVNLDDGEQCCECDSVWRSDDDGDTYMRVWCKELSDKPTFNGTDTPQLGVLGLAPEEEDEVTTIYLADRGTETVYYADDSGLCKWNDRNSGLDAITDIAVADEATIYALDFDGDDEGVAKSTQHARRWDSPEDSGVDEGHTIVCVGENVLVGGTDGKVGYSDDGGASFSELDDIGDGEVHVAFDSYFADNDYVYAAVAGADRGIYRSTIADADFEDMEPCDFDYYGILISYPDGNPETTADTGGVLYAAYAEAGVTDFPDSGVARCLNPASDLCCGNLSWDYLHAKLGDDVEFNTQPSDLDLCGCLTSGTDTTLWAIDNARYYVGWDWVADEFDDSAAGRVWVYDDCFAKAGPDLIGVADGATIPSDPCYCYNEEFVLEWERDCNACEYEIQIALDEGFRHVVWDTTEWANKTHDRICESAIELYKPPKPASPSLLVVQDMLDCNEDYWWRVRSHYAETGEIIRSQWSDKWSFTVAVGPGGAIELTSPDDGATNVALEGVVFTWTAVADATGYDFALMDASGGSIDSKTGLTGTSYAYSGKLSYDTAYTWQVSAMKNGNVLSESAVSTFRSVSESVPPAEFPELVVNIPPAPGTPAWVWAIIGIGAVLVITVIVLIFRTRKV